MLAIRLVKIVMLEREREICEFWHLFFVSKIFLSLLYLENAVNQHCTLLLGSDSSI